VRLLSVSSKRRDRPTTHLMRDDDEGSIAAAQSISICLPSFRPATWFDSQPGRETHATRNELRFLIYFLCVPHNYVCLLFVFVLSSLPACPSVCLPVSDTSLIDGAVQASCENQANFLEGRENEMAVSESAWKEIDWSMLQGAREK